MKDYERYVWARAVYDAEQEVMRSTATPCGGRRKDETLPDYVARTRKDQEEALERWSFAQQKLESLK